MPVVGTTLTDLSVSSTTCSATGTMFLLLGSTITWSAGTASTASRICAVAGFMDWPPATMRCTPRERKMRPMPSPVPTATTEVVTGVRTSPSGPAGARAASRTQRSSSTCSARSVTRIDRGRPVSSAASTAAPMSSVWMWQFHRPSPPTTTIESPTPAHTSLKAGMAPSGASRRYMTS